MQSSIPRWIFAIVVFAVGCGGAEAADVEHGDVEANPSLLALPSYGEHDDLSEHMRFGWTLAEEAISLPRPPEPPGGSTAAFSDWADGDLQRWLERKSRTVEAARRELDAAADEEHRQRIMAGAIVGLVYEDAADGLRSLPVPSELHSEPEIADMFRDILEAHASPYLEHARRAYRACAANAEGGPDATMTHWAPFCRGRLGRLPEPRQ